VTEDVILPSTKLFVQNILNPLTNAINTLSQHTSNITITLLQFIIKINCPNFCIGRNKRYLFEILGPLGAFDVQLCGCFPANEAHMLIISRSKFEKSNRRKERGVTGRRNGKLHRAHRRRCSELRYRRVVGSD